MFYFHPYLGKISKLTNIFQMGWFNHQPVFDAFKQALSFQFFFSILFWFAPNNEFAADTPQSLPVGCFQFLAQEAKWWSMVERMPPGRDLLGSSILGSSVRPETPVAMAMLLQCVLYIIYPYNSTFE